MSQRLTPETSEVEKIYRTPS